MRTGRALLAGVAMTVTALAIPPAAAAGTPAAITAGPPQVTMVGVTPGGSEVDGLALPSVRVNIGLRNNTWGDPDKVILPRVNRRKWDISAPDVLVGSLVRSSGTATEGSYRSWVPVPSSASGDFRAALIHFPNGAVLDAKFPGLPDVIFAASGVHRPRLRVTVKPQPLPYPQRFLKVIARLSFDDTGAPIAGAWVFFGQAASCRKALGPAFKVKTDAHGVATWRTSVGTAGTPFCAWMPFPSRTVPTDQRLSYAFARRAPVLGTVLSATPSRTSVPYGTTIDVNGRAVALVPSWSLSPRVRVVLEQLVGRHWRQVSEGTVRPSGRFTLSVSPPRGRNYYRAALPAQQYLGGSTSKSFVIRGT
jgi:hypothetical protein